jgi:hypothetical protein
VLLVNNDLVRAIRERRLIEFAYRGGGPRTAEPHDYGVLKGVESLVAFQMSGASRSGGVLGWRQFSVADMQRLRVLDEHFSGSRADSAQHHRQWDMLFARVGGEIREK